jgi:hypothetical protein
MLEIVGIPEWHLGVHKELLGEVWKNQWLEFDLSVKTYIQRVISRFEGLSALLTSK